MAINIDAGPTTIRTVSAMFALTIFAGVALLEGYNGNIVMVYIALMAALAGVEYVFPGYREFEIARAAERNKRKRREQ